MKKIILSAAIVLAFVAGCQKNTDAELSLPVGSVEFDNTGGRTTVEVSSNIGWSATVVAGADWLSLSPTSGSAGSTLTVIASPNPDETARTGEVLVSSRDKAETISVTQAAATLDVGATSIALASAGETRVVTVTTSVSAWGDWSAELEPAVGWCTVTTSDAGVSLTAAPNTGGQRTTTLRITAANITREIPIKQVKHESPYADREVVQLQEATRGNGVELIFMGDGFTSADMAKQTGKYEVTMRAAADHFFSVYPYNAYREYFNVWMVVAVSNEEGISVAYSTTVDNRFQTTWDGATTSLRCNTYIVEEYAQRVTDRLGKSLSDVSIIIPVNHEQRAGSCQLFDSGKNISLCGIEAASFRGIVVHEAGGHGFGKLADEYIYFPDQTLPSTQIAEIANKKSKGFCANLDLHSTIAESTWAEFAGKPGYGMVGMFEGGYLYGKGVWRPEESSCMEDETLFYFSAPSRWDIIRRIMKLSGEDGDYTVAEFIADDERPTPSGTRARVAGEKFVPLGPTLWIEE